MTVPGNLSSPLLATAAAAAAGPADTGRSLRFNSGDSTHLTRTPSSAGNRKTFTFSCWLKRTKFGESHLIVDSQNGVASTPRGSFQIDQDDRLRFNSNPTGSSWTVNVKSENLLRDSAAWYHLVCSVDTTQSTASNRVRLYINNEEIDYNTANYPTQNTDLPINQALEHRIGCSTNNSLFLNGYLANIVFVDGSQLTPSSFGAYDSNGVWQHADYSGTYGTQGYELNFTDGSSLGDDSSGNDNDWTPQNLTGEAPVSYSGTSSITVNNSNTLQVGSLAAVFNGTQDANATNAYGFSNGAMDFTWTPNTAISYSSKVRVWTGFSGGSVYLNGGSAVSSVNNNWTTLVSGSSGSITSIQFTVGQSGGWWAALEIDDVVLTDGSPSDLDLLFDNPTNGAATDSGAGGQVNGNYCIFNVNDSNQTITQGGLFVTCAGGTAPRAGTGTIAVSSGKYYYEVTVTESDAAKGIIGFVEAAYDGNGSSIPNVSSNGVFYFGEAGNKIIDNTSTSYGASYTVNDVIGVALNLDDGDITFYKNGSSQGKITTKTFTGAYKLATGHGSSSGSSTYALNTGQKPFKYVPPKGFLPLNSATARPNTVIARPDQYVGITTWKGDGNTGRQIRTLSFSPDLVWIKQSSASRAHAWFDTVRGPNKRLQSSTTNGETTHTDQMSAFLSNGFTVEDNNTVNVSDGIYRGFCWKAGGSKNTFNIDDVGYSSATAAGLDGGSITPTGASIGTKQGFSIIGYTGTDNTSDTFAHGLLQKPDFALFKNRSQDGDDWISYNSTIALGATRRVKFNTADGSDSQTSQFNDTEPTSSLFTIGTYDNINKLNNNYIAYIWHNVPGLQKFGEFLGDGGSGDDGPFVETGFRPALIWLRPFAGTGIANNGGWYIWDVQNDSNPYNDDYAVNNPGNYFNYGNLNNGMASHAMAGIDILSNGFKLRTDTAGYSNYSGWTYIYCAFADTPASNLYGGQSNAR